MSDKSSHIDFKSIGRIIVVIVMIAIFVGIVLFFTLGKSDDTSDSSVGMNISSAGVKDMYPYPGGIVLLKDNSVEYYSSSGDLISSNSHAYSSPAITVNGRNVLIYDLGGKKIRIEKKCASADDIEVNSSIICAAINKKGSYAYSLNADSGYQSHFFVYSSNNRLLFEGQNADYVNCIALSDSHNYCAAGILSTDNAKIVSTVKLYSFSDDSALYSVTFDNTVVYKLTFGDKDSLLCYTNNGLYKIDKTGAQSTVLSYTSAEINLYDTHFSGVGTVSTAVYGNENYIKVYAVSKKGELLYSKDFADNLTDLSVSRKYLSVLLDNTVYTYDVKGNIIGSAEFSSDCSKIVVSDGNIYVLGSEDIYCLSVRRNYGNVNIDDDKKSDSEATDAVVPSETDTTLEEITSN